MAEHLEILLFKQACLGLEKDNGIKIRYIEKQMHNMPVFPKYCSVQ